MVPHLMKGHAPCFMNVMASKQSHIESDGNSNQQMTNQMPYTSPFLPNSELFLPPVLYILYCTVWVVLDSASLL